MKKKSLLFGFATSAVTVMKDLLPQVLARYAVIQKLISQWKLKTTKIKFLESYCNAYENCPIFWAVFYHVHILNSSLDRLLLSDIIKLGILRDKVGGRSCLIKRS